MQNTLAIFLNYAERFIIGGIKFCSSSKRTITIKFNDLAVNRPLLDLICLPYLHLKSDTEEIAWFGGYLSSFSTEHHEQYRKYFLSNPELRILIMDKQLLNDIKEKFPDINFDQ